MKNAGRATAFFAAFLIVFMHMSCRAEDLPRAGSPIFTTIDVLERTQSKAKTLKSLTGKFRQVKHSRFLVAPLESEGVFHWRPPERFRWEVTQPTPFVVVANGDTVLLHYPDLKRAGLFRHPSGESLLGEISGTAGDLESLKRSYYTRVLPSSDAESRGLVHLSLVPKAGRQSRYIKEIQVMIDPATWLPRQIEILESGSDRTLIRLSDLVENASMEETLFNVTPPDGVKLQRVDGSERS